MYRRKNSYIYLQGICWRYRASRSCCRDDSICTRSMCYQDGLLAALDENQVLDLYQLCSRPIAILVVLGQEFARIQPTNQRRNQQAQRRILSRRGGFCLNAKIEKKLKVINIVEAYQLWAGFAVENFSRIHCEDNFDSKNNGKNVRFISVVLKSVLLFFLTWCISAAYLRHLLLLERN